MKLTRNHLIGAMKIVTDIFITLLAFRLISFFWVVMVGHHVFGNFGQVLGNVYTPEITISLLFLIPLDSGFFLFILWQFRKILVIFSSAHLFEPSNISRIASVGYAFFLVGTTEVVSLIIFFFFNKYSEKIFVYTSRIAFNDVQFFFAGLVILVVAAIFRLGAEMYNEQKLTV